MYVDVECLEEVPTCPEPLCYDDGHDPFECESVANDLLAHGPSHSSDPTTEVHDVWETDDVANDVPIESQSDAEPPSDCERPVAKQSNVILRWGNQA